MEQLRLNKKETKEIEKKWMEINKLLINQEKPPMSKSEIIHFILDKSITCVKVTKKGEVVIDY